jgi:hypothetical protein
MEKTMHSHMDLEELNNRNFIPPQKGQVLKCLTKESIWALLIYSDLNFFPRKVDCKSNDY